MPPTHKPRLVLSASDAAKLEDIWKNHALPVRSMLLAFCSNPEDADDALQELFLRLGRNPSVLENTKSPRAFLAVSARRIAIDHARKRASELRHSESPEAAEMLHPAASSAAPGDDLGAKILEALQSLPPEQRRVAESKLLHGKTLDAIAREEGVPLNTAASRLRYSLDKIRTRLRPIYKAMKNQPTSANSASDSTTRLIRPLEPKRVPSVVPGLEGVAACAFEDSQEIPELPVEIPQSENETAEEPILIVCPPPLFFDYTTSEPNFDLFEDSSDSSETGEETEESSTDIDELFYALFEDENAESTDDASEPELGDLVDCVILPVESEEESIDPTAEVEIQPFDPAEFNDYLLEEYNNFLSENPDWISSNSGGEIQAQVMTPSQYAAIDLPNPGEACAFDLWFENSYLNYSETDPVEGDNTFVEDGETKDSGTILLTGEPRDFGTELTPEPVYSLGSDIVFNTGAIQFKDGSGEILPYQRSSGELSLGSGIVPVLGDTQQTVVTGGELAMNQPVEGKFVVEQGAKMTVGDQAYGEGSYEMSAEGQIAALPTAADTTAQEEAAVQAAAQSGIPAVEASNSPVTPIVSGSNSVLESPAAERVSSFNGESQLDQPDIELPTLIETRIDSSSGESVSTDDIAFIDDAPAYAIHASEPAPQPTAAPGIAQQDIAAAVGGAFVAGSATQAPTGRGTVAKKGAIG
jgi:RNA polymerase sigma-70 factor (ECF subfamily)